MGLERTGKKEPGEPTVHDQLLVRRRYFLLQLIYIAVHRVVELCMQVELQRRHSPRLSHLPVQVSYAHPAHAQAPGKLSRHGALSAAEIAADDDGPVGEHLQSFLL